MSVRSFLRNHWPSITIAVTAAVIACAAIVMLSNMPPDRIVMVTGPEGGTRQVLGERYRAALARSNVEVQLVPTAGSVENLAKLRDPHGGADVALIEGAASSAKDASGLQSLGVVFYEPLWWFRKREIPDTGVDALRGRKVSIGPEGSATRALSLELIKQNGMEGQFGELLGLPPQEARDKLLTGDIDVAFIMMAWESPIVRQLLADERVRLSGYARAEQGGGAKGGDRSGAGPTASRSRPDRNQGKPRGSQGSASRDSIPAAEYGERDPFETEHFSPCQ